MGSRSFHRNGQFWGERGAHCKVSGLSAVSCAKTAELIDLPFWCGFGWAEGSISSIVFARWRQFALMRGHIGVTWRIRLNRPSAAAMRRYVKLLWVLVMVALCNRADHYIFILFLSSFFCRSSFFSSPDVSGRRLDVYHTSAHGVALVRI